MVQLISGGGDGQPDFEKEGAVIKMVNQEKKMLKKRGTKKKPLLFLAPEKPEEVKKEEDSRTFKEGPLMTKCDGVWVKRQFVEEYEKLKVSLENQILLSREKKRLLYKARRVAHKKLVNELYREKDKKPKKLKSFKKTLPPPKAMSLKETKELSRKFEEKKGKARTGKNKKASKTENPVEEDGTEPEGKKKKLVVKKETKGDKPENQDVKEVTKKKNKEKKGAETTKKTGKTENGETPIKLTKKRKQGGKEGDFTEENTVTKKNKKGGKKGINADLLDELLKEKKANKRAVLKEKKAKKKALLLAKNAKAKDKTKESIVVDYKENETMTNIDGFWIRKEIGKNVEDLRSNLTSGNNMKKKLKSEQRKLLKKLKKNELKKK